MQSVVKLRDEDNLSWAELAAKSGTSERTVRRWYAAEKGGDATQQPEEEQDPVEQMQERLRSQADARATQQAVKAAAKERNFRQFLTKELHGLIPQSRVVPVPALPKADKTASVESVVFQWSDWHLDETVKQESVLGMNEFNLAIALSRASDLVRRSFSIIDRMERGDGWVIEEAVVSVNGDMITGAIHGLEKHTATGNVVLNSWLCAQVLRDAILLIAKRFPVVRVYFTPGNHTRFENEKNFNEPLRTWDSVIALMVAESLRNQPNVTVTIPDSYLATYQVQGFNVLQTHGEELSSQFGISTERLQQRLTYLQNVHYFLLGHWHQTADYPALQGKVLFNGSLIGGNAYSLGKLGKVSPPEQGLHFFKKEKGLTSSWTIKPDVFPTGQGLFGPYGLS